MFSYMFGKVCMIILYSMKKILNAKGKLRLIETFSYFFSCSPYVNKLDIFLNAVKIVLIEFP